MPQVRGIVAGLALTATLVAAAAAQQGPERGDIAAGRDFATNHCDACHIVAPNQQLRPLVSDYGPAFSDIANKPGTTADSLRAFLSRPHAYARMPYPALSPPNLDNVIAYILSLRTRH